MVFVLNKRYGGFSLSPFAVEQLGIEDEYSFDASNTQQVEALANLINEYGSEKCSGSSAKLRVIEIPNTFTDYEIMDYDGVETIIYVVDGKIYHA